MKEFTPEELSACNGENGRPVYVAHEGKVYDVTESRFWKNGLHMRRHRAGADLTAEIGGAPHGPETLARFPQVGVLRKAADPLEERLPAPLAALLRTFPFLRRHPHPMTVHFPIVFMFSATAFSLLYLLTDEKSFETTAFHCLGAGVFFNAVGIATGFYTWWLNYLARPLRPVRIKIPLTLLMWAISILLFVWRWRVPGILDSLSGLGLAYILLVLSLAVLVTVIGWNGAAMTFPVEKD